MLEPTNYETDYNKQYMDHSCRISIKMTTQSYGGTIPNKPTQ